MEQPLAERGQSACPELAWNAPVFFPPLFSLICFCSGGSVLELIWYPTYVQPQLSYPACVVIEIADHLGTCVDSTRPVREQRYYLI